MAALESGVNMTRQHSDDTKKKIGDGVRASHQRKRDAANPTQAVKRKYADGFASGHPEGLRPRGVRNYGSMGDDLDIKIMEPAPLNPMGDVGPMPPGPMPSPAPMQMTQPTQDARANSAGNIPHPDRGPLPIVRRGGYS